MITYSVINIIICKILFIYFIDSVVPKLIVCLPFRIRRRKRGHYEGYTKSAGSRNDGNSADSGKVWYLRRLDCDFTNDMRRVRTPPRTTWGGEEVGGRVETLNIFRLEHINTLHWSTFTFLQSDSHNSFPGFELAKWQ